MPFGFRWGRKRKGQGRGPAHLRRTHTPFSCVCPNCNGVLPQKAGIPCFKIQCPRCGSYMVRQFREE